MKSKTVYVVSGANGSGKTTFAKEFVKTSNLIFLNADEIEKEFNPDDQEGGKIRAGRIFFKQLKDLIQSDSDFIIESTLSGKSLISRLKKLKQNGFKIIILYVFLGNIKMAIERVRIRVEEGGHHIPKKDITRRYSRSINNFWYIYKNIADEWQIFYNGDDNVIQTALGFKEQFQIIDEERFNTFKRGFNVKS